MQVNVNVCQFCNTTVLVLRDGLCIISESHLKPVLSLNTSHCLFDLLLSALYIIPFNISQIISPIKEKSKSIGCQCLSFLTHTHEISERCVGATKEAEKKAMVIRRCRKLKGWSSANMQIGDRGLSLSVKHVPTQHNTHTGTTCDCSVCNSKRMS